MIQKIIKIVKAEILFWLVIGLLLIMFSCKKSSSEKILAINTNTEITKIDIKEPVQEFKDYWYSGEAEITSYKLKQARYGEMRDGHAVLIYVTEDFLPITQVKADNKNPDNIPILKLNTTKKFNTGIYPYSIMQSTFYPVSNNQHALKVSSSMQEWCGHVYTQLNNRKDFEITSHSYFEGSADEKYHLDKDFIENELWTQLRIDPNSLPIGNIHIIPSFEYTRLRHVPIKAYKALATLKDGLYTITYPELERTLTIQFNPNFPYDIIGWEESFNSGFGNKTKKLTTRASKLKTIKSKYWSKNSNNDERLRDTLQLN
jgi:hypothetical protein